MLKSGSNSDEEAESRLEGGEPLAKDRDRGDRYRDRDRGYRGKGEETRKGGQRKETGGEREPIIAGVLSRLREREAQRKEGTEWKNVCCFAAAKWPELRAPKKQRFRGSYGV